MIRAGIALVMMLQAEGAAAQAVPPLPPPVPTPIPSAAHDAPIFPIGPIGAWEQDRDIIGSCAASRNYGSAERPVTVTVQSGPATPRLTVYVVSGAAGAEQRSGDGAMIPHPGKALVGNYSSFDVPVRDQHFSVLYVDRPAVGTLAAARTVVLQADRTTTIPADDMKAAVDMNDSCVAQLLQSWGIDPARFGPDKPAPKPLGGGPAYWFKADDYPPAALRAAIQGRVLMVLDVGKDGLVKSCHVVVSAGPDLDATSCRLVTERASFAPATDAQGKPIASLEILPVRWVLP